MKKRLCYFFVVLYFLSVSCSKSNFNTASVTFTGNGAQYSMPVATFTKVTATDHILEAGDHLGNHISLFNNYTLTPGTYPKVAAEASLAHAEYAGDSSITMIITSVHNGLADGTFSGSMLQFATTTNPNPTDTVTITNGVFKNLLIQQ